jgi:ribosomal protein L24
MPAKIRKGDKVVVLSGREKVCRTGEVARANMRGVKDHMKIISLAPGVL